jgi:hypothetical protein
MKRSETVLTILATGSLWGLFEMLRLPTGILCAIGIFFLTLARFSLNMPGSSSMIGVVVCLFKTYSAHFMTCQTAGVMSLALSFDLFSSLLANVKMNEYAKSSLLSTLSNTLALPIFLVWVTFIVRLSYWVDGGWGRAFMYLTTSVLPAIILGSLLSAAAVYMQRNRVFERFGLSAYSPARLFLPAIIVAWSIASAVKFL